jgi:hypothetical protein
LSPFEVAPSPLGKTEERCTDGGGNGNGDGDDDSDGIGDDIGDDSNDDDDGGDAFDSGCGAKPPQPGQ